MATAANERDANWVAEGTKPPFLRRVRIQGYKSIAHCEASLQPLTILVGRNGSGKSNFLDALAFLRDAITFNLPEALKRHGGLQSILCRSAPVDGFTIAVEAGFEVAAGHNCLVHYSLTIPANGSGNGVQHRESLLLRDLANHREVGFRVANGYATLSGNGAKPALTSPNPVTPGHLFLNMGGNLPAVLLARSLESMGFYSFHPESIRRLQKPSLGWMLERDGSNLASVIRLLAEVEPATLTRVRDYLATIADDVQDFQAVQYGEYETVRFKMRTKSAGPPLEFDAASISDGTLRALASLAAAFQRGQPMPYPSVIGIEEPESFLHPAASSALVDALEEATSRTQILLTTHSGDLLADRQIGADNLLVVRMRDGQTQIAPVDPASREILRKELYTLADLQRMDQLDLDEADLQRQANSKPVNDPE
jgi:predicted ATPase